MRNLLFARYLVRKKIRFQKYDNLFKCDNLSDLIRVVMKQYG